MGFGEGPRVMKITQHVEDHPSLQYILQRRNFSCNDSEAMKWKHICVMRGGHLATCEPAASILYRQGWQEKVQTENVNGS